MAAKALKVGIIGTGGISSVHYSGYLKSKLAEVYALCDIKPDVLQEKSDTYKVPAERCFADHRELLRLKEIDAVSVCTPNGAHCEITVNALKAGKHVLCEKPMALNPAQADRMNAAAAKAGRKLQVGLMQRFRPDARFIRKLVDNGTLGKIYYGRSLSVRRRGAPSWGVFGQKEIQGGGPLIDIGVHAIDLTWWLMGCPRPIAVSGQTYQTIGTRPGGIGMFGPWDHKTYTVEDFACGLVRFENGATMSVESAFNVNLEKSREGNIHVVGDRGGAGLGPLTVQIEQNGHLVDCTPCDVDQMDSCTPYQGLTIHEKEVRSFCECILEDRPVLVPGTEAVWTTKMISGLYRSAELGKEVAIR